MTTRQETELERLRFLASCNEASAKRHAAMVERGKWQSAVAKQDALIAEGDALAAELDALMARVGAWRAERNAVAAEIQAMLKDGDGQ